MILFGLCVAATIFGLVLIASAADSYESTGRLLIVQAGGAFLGIILFIAFSLIDMDDLAGYWKVILAFNIIFVASTFFIGVEVSGNKSWIEIPLIGIRAQPAEIVKVSFILLLAKQMYVLRDRISHPLSVGMIFGHFALMIGIIWIASGDMGMAVVYIFIFICMAFASGIRFWWFLGGGAAVVAAAPVIWRSLGEYQRMRILVVIDDTLDPLGIGWHTTRSKLALGSGKFLGQGLFNGTQTQKGVLPAKHTDYIYSVAGEELGMVGCVIILCLLVAIIIRCLYVATRAKNGMGSLICVGMAAMLIFQTFENIGMCIGLTPVIGITLPFFSYGGSSVMTMFAAMGMVSSVKMRPMPGWLKSTRA